MTKPSRSVAPIAVDHPHAEPTTRVGHRSVPHRLVRPFRCTISRPIQRKVSVPTASDMAGRSPSPKQGSPRFASSRPRQVAGSGPLAVVPTERLRDARSQPAREPNYLIRGAAVDAIARPNARADRWGSGAQNPHGGRRRRRRNRRSGVGRPDGRGRQSRCSGRAEKSAPEAPNVRVTVGRVSQNDAPAQGVQAPTTPGQSLARTRHRLTCSHSRWWTPPTTSWP